MEGGSKQERKKLKGECDAMQPDPAVHYSLYKVMVVLVIWG